MGRGAFYSESNVTWLRNRQMLRADSFVRFVVLLDHDVNIVVKKSSRPGVPARLMLR